MLLLASATPDALHKMGNGGGILCRHRLGTLKRHTLPQVGMYLSVAGLKLSSVLDDERIILGLSCRLSAIGYQIGPMT